MSRASKGSLLAVAATLGATSPLFVSTLGGPSSKVASRRTTAASSSSSVEPSSRPEVVSLSFLAVAGATGGALAMASVPRSTASRATTRAVSEDVATTTPVASLSKSLEQEPEVAVKQPFDPAQQLGAVEPLGFWDPLGFTAVGDEAGFRNLRAAEIKHGRVAMMASIGAIGQPFLKLPWFDTAKGTFGALASGRTTFGMFMLFVACGILELAWRQEQDKEPGNFGDPFGVDMYNDEMRNKEINNGRMAMISVLGIFAAELATGKDAIQQLTLFAVSEEVATVEQTVASIGKSLEQEPEVAVKPPFDPAQQLGAVEPLGFWDPLGFTAVGDEAGFRNLRAAEIKHGRVAMMASIGAIGQPFLKLPWFDTAKGTFGALASGRTTFGMFMLFVACGILELAWRQEQDKEPGNFGDPFGVDMDNDEMRNKEINNGRMAMISVLGIFAAELATGKDAIQQLTLFAVRREA